MAPKRYVHLVCKQLNNIIKYLLLVLNMGSIVYGCCAPKIRKSMVDMMHQILCAEIELTKDCCSVGSDRIRS